MIDDVKAVSRWLTAAMAACVVAALATKACAEETEVPRQPTVVELFTSEGCSACPPANENIRALAEEPGVLALSYSVTYWDYLGWKDAFGKEAFTDRQRGYIKALGLSSPYTPQVVVDGRRDAIGNRRGDIDRAIAASDPREAAPSVAVSEGMVALGEGLAPSGGADVWLVRYDPRTLGVAVARGENRGQTMAHKNVVRDIEWLGTWSGHAASLVLPTEAPQGIKTAILVQVPEGGPILGAATD